MKNIYSLSDVNMVRTSNVSISEVSANSIVDEANMHYKTFVDIKSEPLRDLLREVLCDVNTISLRGDKPEVSSRPRVPQSAKCNIS